MTDDIVTRLREKYLGQLPICAEAADEIERLREKLAYHVRIHNEMYNRLDLWGLVAKFEAEDDSDD